MKYLIEKNVYDVTGKTKNTIEIEAEGYLEQDGWLKFWVENDVVIYQIQYQYVISVQIK